MRLSSTVLLPFVLLAACASAQPATETAPPSHATVGFMHAIHATNRVDDTLGFYTKVFGISTEILPFEHPGVALLTNSPGVSLRVAMLRLPGHGFNFELTEFTKTERHPAQPSIVDSGAPHMKFLVRDLTPVLEGLDAVNATIITRSTAPVRVTTSLGPVDAIFFRDPDGYIVEAIQVPAGSAPAGDGNVVGAIMGLTVRNLDESLAFWEGKLGFKFDSDEAYSNDAATLDLYGIKGNISYRMARGIVPGSDARIELVEFKGVPSNSFDLRVPDPGASGMCLRVASIETLVPKLAAAGVRVTSKDQKLVEWTDAVRNVFVKDPNGLNLELAGEVGK